MLVRGCSSAAETTGGASARTLRFTLERRPTAGRAYVWGGQGMVGEARRHWELGS
jgi:hypothetical protein